MTMTSTKPRPYSGINSPLVSPYQGFRYMVAGAMAAVFALYAQASLATTGKDDASVWIDEEPRVELSAGQNVMIPTTRPDPSIMIPLAPEGMVLPELRPDRRSLYPKTTLTLDEFYQQRLGLAPNQSAQRFKLKSGEGLATMLKRGGMSGTDAQNAIAVIADHRSLRSLPIGFMVDIIPPKGKAAESDEFMGALRLPLEDDFDLTVYQSTDGAWLSQISTRPIERFLTYTNGEIETSLYKASINAGMSDNVFNTFVQVLSFSVDFQREIQKGDQFEALFETKRDLISGKTKYGTELYYLSMTLSGDRLEYFRHEHADGTIGWYDDAGNSASRTLMRTPVNGARLSSGYGKRKHPVLGYSKMHRGLDFAAPTGTPIMAAGSGVVEYSGWNGSYGKYIRIRHNSTYKTAYAHMSRIKRGVTPGARVKQGQIIGYIGSTGRSTGPHLHYEILVNNRKTNPMTVRLPAGKSIPDEERAPFELSLAAVEQELTARGIVRFASE
ncbi:MAG: peptidoglycan DD-metalloendopeptidase family protein [Alphaproteobacteria bacterium]|nr:peptidoglycan DD-metalloendopeptidase family protein [Alphaproteobacteria bacterium]